mgnify:FL=1
MQTLIIDCKYDKTLDMLPDSIETLDIKHYNDKINKLPQNLKEIIISNKYNYINDLLLLKPNIIIKN